MSNEERTIRSSCESLSTNAELRDERSVPLDVVAPEVVEHATAAADEHQQPALRVKVLLVDLHVLRQVTDALGEERDLHLGRAGVGVVQLVALLIVAALSGMRA